MIFVKTRNLQFFAGTDGSVSHGEVMEVADSVAFYGIKDMEEILSVIGANCDASLADCRPVKLRHWLQVIPRLNYRNSSKLLGIK